MFCVILVMCPMTPMCEKGYFSNAPVWQKKPNLYVLGTFKLNDMKLNFFLYTDTRSPIVIILNMTLEKPWMVCDGISFPA